MIGSANEIVERPLADADLQWEVGFVHGNPTTQGTLKEGEWNLDLSPLLDTEMFQLATGRVPLAAAIFEENVHASMARLNRVGRSSPSLTNAGRALWNVGNLQDASKMFKEALEIDLTFSPARLSLGRAQVQEGQFDNAFATIEPLLDDDVYGASAAVIAADTRFRAGRPEESLTLLFDAIDQWPNEAVLHHDAGIVLVTQGETPAAIREFRRALRIDPAQGEAHHGLALCYVQQGMNGKAIKEFKLGIATGGMSTKAVRNLGRLYSDTGSHQEAIELLSKHIQTHSADLLAKFVLSNSYFAIDDYQAARRQLLDILDSVEVEPSSLPQEFNYDAILNNIGATYEREGNDSDGIKWLHRALEERGPTGALIRTNLIRAYFGLAQFEQAKQLIDDLHAQYGISATERFLSANYFLASGRYLEAFNLLIESEESEMLDQEGYVSLAFLYGEWKADMLAGIEIVQKGLRKFRSNPLLLNALAYYRIQRGSLDEAKRIMSLPEWPQSTPIAVATEGLWNLMAGEFHNGVTLYNNAKLLASPHLQDIIEQKKRLEMARFYLRADQQQRAIRELKAAISVKTAERYYLEQAEELLQTLS